MGQSQDFRIELGVLGQSTQMKYKTPSSSYLDEQPTIPELSGVPDWAPAGLTGHFRMPRRDKSAGVHAMFSGPILRCGDRRELGLDEVVAILELGELRTK